MDDLALLGEYARSGAHELFARVAGRYVDLIYSAALRQVRDPHVADDVVQAVLIVLMHKAGRLPRGTILPGWLLRVTRYASLDALKLAGRRRRHEQEAARLRPETRGVGGVMSDTQTEASTWEKLSPLLDDALLSLRTADRDAVVLRYLLGKSPEEIAFVMGVNEDAARQRVSRALGRLRRALTLMARMTLPEDALAGMLATRAVTQASARAAQAASAIAAPGGAAAVAPPSVIARGAVRDMSWGRFKTTIGGVGGTLLIAALALLALFPRHRPVPPSTQQPQPPPAARLAGAGLRSGAGANATGPAGSTSRPINRPPRDIDAVYSHTAPTITRLMAASMRTDTDAVTYFLAAGTEDVNAVSRDGNDGTALGYAAGATNDRGYECVRLLIDQGADVNHPFGAAHLTPLMRAVVARSPRTVQLLMDHGADVTRIDRKGRTARDVAADTGDAELIRILSAAGAAGAAGAATRPGA